MCVGVCVGVHVVGALLNPCSGFLARLLKGSASVRGSYVCEETTVQTVAANKDGVDVILCGRRLFKLLRS